MGDVPGRYRADDMFRIRSSGRSGSGDRSRRDGRFRLCRGRRAGGRSRCLPFLRRRAVASLGRRVCAAQLRRPAEIACRRERGGPESLAYIARKPGVDIDELLVSQPDNGGRALEIADQLIPSGAIDIVVIDFVVMLTPKAEMDESKTGPSDPANVLSAAQTDCRYR